MGRAKGEIDKEGSKGAMTPASTRSSNTPPAQESVDDETREISPSHNSPLDKQGATRMWMDELSVRERQKFSETYEPLDVALIEKQLFIPETWIEYSDSKTLSEVAQKNAYARREMKKLEMEELRSIWDSAFDMCQLTYQLSELFAFSGYANNWYGDT